jgi:hypothetical protein
MDKTRSFDLTPFEPNWDNFFYYDGDHDHVPQYTDVWINPPFSNAKGFATRAAWLTKERHCHILMLAPDKELPKGLNCKVRPCSSGWSFTGDGKGPM